MLYHDVFLTQWSKEKSSSEVLFAASKRFSLEIPAYASSVFTDVLRQIETYFT